MEFNKNTARTFTFKSHLLWLVFALFSFSTFAQKSINVKYIDNLEFSIDGVLDEPMWDLAEVSGGFHEYYPTDSREVDYQTEIRMLYNEDYLYIGIKAYAPGKAYNAPSYQRDFSISGADVINFMFDTFSDRTNAFLFGINQFGVHREGLISNGGVTGNLDLSWDTKWMGESVMYKDYSITEIRIPMSSFKFREGVDRWKFNAMRSCTQSNTKSSWSKVPQNQDQLNLGYYGDMIFEKPLGQSLNPISIIPYVTPSYLNDNIAGTKEFSFSAGFDVKIPVGSSYMVDLTINPDFSSADVVQGENNTTRFEIKKPETRQFFIDNGDLFNNFGLEEDALAFYSRRVGVGVDENNRDTFIPIIAGAKFTGKVNNGLRVGALNVQTLGDEDKLIPDNNNTVLAAEQKLGSNSSLVFYFINRQVTNPSSSYSGSQYNRVTGTDYRYFSKSNEFDAHVYIHKSFTPEIESNAVSTGTNVNLEKRHYSLRFTGQYIDSGFQADLGYIRRKDIVRLDPFAEFILYPEWNSVNTIKLNIQNNSFWMPSENMKYIDSDLLLGGEINFTNQSKIGIVGASRFVHLFEPFDPVGSGEENTPLPVGDYNTHDLELEFQTDKRKAFWMEGSTSYGSFYLGNKFTADFTCQYRFQPIFFVSFKVQYDDIVQPEPYGSDQLWFLGPTLNVTFTKSLFWNTDVQYSTQTNTFFMVSRLQWRYAPLSDIYLTYSDTYDTSPSSHIERGLYLRVNYWFDIKRKSK